MPKYSREELIELHKQGASTRSICKKLRIRPLTVKRWIARWKATGSLEDLPRSKCAKITPELRSEIFRLSSEGYCLNQISEMIKPRVSRKSVREVLSGYTQFRPRKITSAVREKVFQLARAGFSSREISSRVEPKISFSTVCRLLRKRLKYER